MMSLVVPGIVFARAARIFESVAVSTAEVLSSSMSILGFLSRSPCDTQTLLLATGYVGSALFYVGVVLVREGLDKVIGACHFTGRSIHSSVVAFLSPQRRFSSMVPRKARSAGGHSYLVSESVHVVFTHIVASDDLQSRCLCRRDGLSGLQGKISSFLFLL